MILAVYFDFRIWRGTTPPFGSWSGWRVGAVGIDAAEQRRQGDFHGLEYGAGTAVGLVPQDEGKVMRYLVDHDIRMPVRCRSGLRMGELEWCRVNRISLHNLFRNPIYAGAYVYGMRSVDRRQQKPGRPSTGRRPPQIENAAVFLPDRLPAYISWEQCQRNQAQLRSNRAASTGPVRAGQALLSGLLVCGRCGLRMAAQYNNNGRDVRYICGRMAADYGEAICQTIKGAPLDALVGRLVVEALAPAAIEASLLVAADLTAERDAIDRQWRQRLERAGYEAERARRQYDAVDPENRLVARTLERQWEEALADLSRLESEHADFQRQQPKALSQADLVAIQDLARDVPAVWHAGSREDRQTIVRLLLERVIIEVVDGSEQVQVQCHWYGGNRTSHRLVRPVARLDQLSTYHALAARAAELHRAGRDFTAIADILNVEGWKPAKRRDTFNAQMVHHLLQKTGAVSVRYRRTQPDVNRAPDEWTIRELAHHLGMPEPTLYTWVQQCRLRSRLVTGSGRPVKLVHADEAVIAELKAIRSTPAPWRRLPAPATPSQSPSTES